MKPKPIKPRRMWAGVDLENTSWTRPVLVIDLSPESVEKMARDLGRWQFDKHQKKIAMLGGVKLPWSNLCEERRDAFWYEPARQQLAAIGIRPVKGGRK